MSDAYVPTAFHKDEMARLQAEVERLREENRQRGFAKVRARIDAALKLHHDKNSAVCRACERPMPCPTVKALQGGANE